MDVLGIINDTILILMYVHTVKVKFPLWSVRVKLATNSSKLPKKISQQIQKEDVIVKLSSYCFVSR